MVLVINLGGQKVYQSQYLISILSNMHNKLVKKLKKLLKSCENYEKKKVNLNELRKLIKQTCIIFINV